MAGKVSSDPNVFLLPDLGEGLEEAELLEWCVAEGQDVKEHDMLAKMETAKAVVEVYSHVLPFRVSMLDDPVYQKVSPNKYREHFA